jgi:hypothetical protein
MTPTIRTDPLIQRLLRPVSIWLARRRLQRMVEDTRNSFETQLFVKNREAQIKRRVK